MHTLPVPLQCTSSDTYQFLKINADCITMWHKALPLDAVEQALVILSANNDVNISFGLFSFLFHCFMSILCSTCIINVPFSPDVKYKCTKAVHPFRTRKSQRLTSEQCLKE